jgi:hypothetical protein
MHHRVEMIVKHSLKLESVFALLDDGSTNIGSSQLVTCSGRNVVCWLSQIAAHFPSGPSWHDQSSPVHGYLSLHTAVDIVVYTTSRLFLLRHFSVAVDSTLPNNLC